MKRLAVICCLLTACMGPFDPFAGAEPFSPPTVYREWWAQVEACSGTTGNFSAVRWYTRDAFDRPSKVATSDYATQSVVLLPSIIEDGMAVRHEMLHLLLKQPGHPVEYFETRCGSIVEH